MSKDMDYYRRYIKEKYIQVPIRMRAEQKQLLDEAVEKAGVSRNKFILDAIFQKIEQEKENESK